MKITVDIPNDELQEVLRHTGAHTKRAAIVIAIAEFNRRRRLARLVERFGTCDQILTHEELAKLRAEG